MKTLSRLVVLAVLLSLASLAPLSAQEIAAPAAPAPVVDLSFADSGAQSVAALRCVQYFCPIYPDLGCSCEWVPCDGGEVCGVPRYPQASVSTDAGCGAPAASTPAL